MIDLGDLQPDWQSDDGNVVLFNGDCLDILPKLPGGCVDMTLCDPPYGTTACKWDTIVDPAAMWSGLKSAGRPETAIVMTASQPFTTTLINSNRRDFRYCWVWDKVVPSGFNYARFQPMRQHEDVVVFYESPPVYYSDGEAYESLQTYAPAASPSDSSHMTHTMPTGTKLTATHRKQRSILRVQKVRQGQHPTEKPVGLMAHMIETYSTPDSTILDPFLGSGTTAVACVKTGRRCIGIEREEKYFDIAVERVQAAYADAGLFTGAIA